MIDINSLFSSLTLDTFAKNYWGEKEFFSATKHELLSDLITLDIIKDYLKDPLFYRKATVLLRSNSFSVDEVQPHTLNEVLDGVESGLSLQIRHLQKVLPSDSALIQLAKRFEKTLIAPLDSITFFYSLPISQPTSIHKDIGEIFTLQISGKKHWKIAKEKSITDKMSFKDNEITNWNNYILEAGNMLYSPSYLPHQVKCYEEPSTSVALVFRNIQFENFFHYLKDEPTLREWLIKPLPMMGNMITPEIAKYKIEKFIDILIQRVLCLDKTSMLRDLHDNLIDYHIK